jgi:hypothetical protein
MKQMLKLESITKNLLKIVIFGLLFAVFLSPISANAQSLTPSKDQICGGPCPLIDTEFDGDSDSLFSFVIFFARFLTYIGVGLAVLFFVIAGIQYIVGKSEEGKNNLITTFIGLIVIILAYTAVNIIVQLLQNGSLGDILGGSDGF